MIDLPARNDGDSTRRNNADDAASQPLLRVRSLSKHFISVSGGLFRRKRIDILKAVDRVSFDIFRGEAFGIVGESGSGKTTAARCILRALRPTSGSVLFHNRGRTVDLTAIPERQLKPLRTEMQMIFQDPFSSLNPRMTVGDIVGEPLLIHGVGNRRERVDRVVEMLERVGLQADHMYRYPHAFSGGQRQRIGIARALILKPAFVVADEAVSALDVSVQARVLQLLKQLQRELNLTYIFVSHDLGVVREFCDRVAVMYKGRLMEMGPTEQLFNNPRHAYTRVLLSAIPYPDPDRKLEPLRVQDLKPEELEPLPELATQEAD
ncbi:ABC transporter ATP-binding protein [Fontivita pretiosa]|uniref:ABC transporter ATP-binding protein n=1 Tax=Fontivita pretiosa TaxID=2989684 RepID=UPI003D174BA1